MALPPQKEELSSYMEGKPGVAVYLLDASPDFSPVDLNVAFLAKAGWSANVDRLRFHARTSKGEDASGSLNPLLELIGSIEPHLLIRKLDKDEDRFVSVSMPVDGPIRVMSNDSDYSMRFVAGLLLECPPAFHGMSELSMSERWEDDPAVVAMFTGMLAGALGWDSSTRIPENIRESLDEARRSLDIANYRSCVVMCRRTIEGVIRFGFPRLLKREAVDKKGKALMLAAMVDAFRSEKPPIIPTHLLHVADSVRLLGNVPGAHPADIKGYHFSKSDAEFAIYSTVHFLAQYFEKIDTQVDEYYTLTIDTDASAGPPDEEGE